MFKYFLFDIEYFFIAFLYPDIMDIGKWATYSDAQIAVYELYKVLSMLLRQCAVCDLRNTNTLQSMSLTI